MNKDSNQLPKVLEDTEILDASDKNFKEKLNFILSITGSSSDWSNARNRAYNGQPHTNNGERGKTEVKGLTMRDVMDCFVKGYLLACKDGHYLVTSGKWRYPDIWKVKDEPDPMAVGQNMMCEVEKMMGIFPNLPKEKI